MKKPPAKTPKQIAAAKYRANNREKIRAAKIAWRKTEAGKASKKRWKETDAGKASAARWHDKPTAKAAELERTKAKRKLSQRLRNPARHPFVGCDGEGIGRGTDHKYVLFRMGERELYNGGDRLTTPELLTFILAHPEKSELLIGFAFEYDTTSILLDIAPRDRAKLFESYEQPAADHKGKAKSREHWTWIKFPGYPHFGINWLAKNHLKICYRHPERKRVSDTRTIRTIYDCFGFFQSSFVKALKAWDIGADHMALIEKMKARRSAFTKVTREMRRYNALECELLAALMTKFRETCHECGLFPRTPNGAGKIASFLHKQHGTIRAADLANLVPRGVLNAAHSAYYGGRFEITRAGAINSTVWEHDINSAYPAAMLSLPCLVHGVWKHTAGELLGNLLNVDPDCIFVAPARFEHPRSAFLCGLPFRSKDSGGLHWPRMGNGVYWSNELRSALAVGASLEIRKGWLYETGCDCRPFDWVNALYLQRKALGDLKGKPIKLGIASLYGKLAQRIGEPPFANPIWAGLITASCRSQINDAIAAAPDPRNIAMIATDGIYSVGADPLALPQGDALGRWKIERHNSMFIVQPGLYWTDTGLKSRGLSAATLSDYRPDFEKAWNDYQAHYKPLDGAKIAARLDALEHHPDRPEAARLAPFAFRDRFPSVKVEFDAFIGLRLASHLKLPKLAGTWQRQNRLVSFDWSGKRQALPEWAPDRSHIIAGPKGGAPLATSAHYSEGGQLSTSEGWERERMLFEAMPDWAGDGDGDGD